MKDEQQDRLMWRRYVDDLYTKDDAGRLLEELHSSDSGRLLDDLAAEIWEETAVQQTYTDLEREKYKKEARQLLQRLEHKKRTWIRRVCYAVSGVAAVLCLIWGSMTYLNYVGRQQISYLEASTSYGEHKEVVLPDGTVLTLNSCSRVRYPNQFVDNERRVELEGEGFFQVSRNEKQPFIINTRFFDVRVLGTCFNVKAYETDSRYETTLVSGCVRVEDTTGLEVTLRPSEQLVLGRDGSHEVREVDTRYYLAWHEGWFYFRNESLRQVLLMVGRWYDVEFECGEGVSVDDRQVTGKVRRFDNLKEILGMLSKVTGVEFKEEGDRIVLYDSK